MTFGKGALYSRLFNGKMLTYQLVYCPDPWEVRGDGRAARGDDRQGGGGREGGRRAGGHPRPRQTAPGHHGVRVGLRGAPRALPRHRLQAEGRLIQILTYIIQGRI